MKRSQISGFTLVELSIVLVIIGLITGGVLVGRDLIFAAQVRQQISQIESLDVATNTFKLKYNAIPGDIKNASELNLGTAGGPGDNGNGNGQLDVGAGSVLETHRFWHHLSRSNLINGTYNQPVPYDPYFGPLPGKDSPALKLPMIALDGNGTPSQRNNIGGIVVAYSRMYKDIMDLPFTNAWLMATSSYDTEAIGGYPGVYARSIDFKLDDGAPTSGNIVGVRNASSASCSGGICYAVLDYGPFTSDGDPDNSCIDDSVTPSVYVNNMKPAAESCALIVRAGF
ncbi:MAG: type II secretion system GspH family protein [Rickettsiales bacterium]|jgi:prepilin-type N-terminal cleavage/methylation domain-containing protein|nr:type II secretion system GspH family protein [Rickettsiales bacterium]